MEHQMIAVFANDFAGDEIDCDDYKEGNEEHNYRERQKVIATVAGIARRYWKFPLQENFISIEKVGLPREKGCNYWWPFVTFVGPIEKMIKLVGYYATGHQAPYTPSELDDIKLHMECLTVNGKHLNVEDVSSERETFVLDQLVIRIED